MLSKIRNLAIFLIPFFHSGCATLSATQSIEYVELSELFQKPLEWDGKNVCSFGYLRIGEAITLHSTKLEAKNSPFENAVVLIIEEDDIVSVSRRDEFKKLEFCGKIDLQSSCWLGSSKDDQDFCVPIKRPVHVIVKSARVY